MIDELNDWEKDFDRRINFMNAGEEDTLLDASCFPDPQHEIDGEKMKAYIRKNFIPRKMHEEVISTLIRVVLTTLDWQLDFFKKHQKP